MSEKESKYVYKKKLAWEIFTKDQIKKAFDFSEEYAGLYEWDMQFSPCNGKPVCDDGTKILVKEDHYDNPNYYILKLS